MHYYSDGKLERLAVHLGLLKDYLTFLAGDLRACSRGGGGPQVGEVPRLGGVTNLSIQSLFFS